MICTKEHRLEFTERAKELVAEMTLDEKLHIISGNLGLFHSMGVGSMYNNFPYGAGGCKRLGVPELLFCDGPRGVVSGHSTCFPVTMARGASFDEELEERVGNAIGAEVRANGGNYYGGVCINVPYNPGWGRSQEVYGEDPTHLAKMGVALMKGVQNQNVVACIKHYAFNSMERARFKVSVTANKRTEREVYLGHFKKCVDAGAASVMSAYNKYDDVHCGHNEYLLRDVLKEEWDFDGFVISDFMFGIRDTVGGITGGCDIEMHLAQDYKPNKVKKALSNGKITEAMLDDMCLRVVRTLLAFEEANDPQVYDKSMIACDEHVRLAREVAEKSITLIKNEGILPLKENIKRIALIGDLAAVKNIGDHGSSMVKPPYVATLKHAIEKEHPEITFDFIPARAVSRKKDIITNADAAIVVCGYRHSDEGEYVFFIGGDRHDLGLHKKDVDMINMVGSLNKNNTVVLMGGNMIRVNEWKDKASSIIMAYYPGMEGGYALADILFGQVSPSGKLPFVVSKEDKDLPQVDWMAEEQHYDYYHGYKKLDKENITCDYPYGFGLSYTSFILDNPKIVSVNDDQATFEVLIKNIGGCKGGEVIQLYVGCKDSAVDRPIRVLKDFKKVYLNPDESQTLQLCVEKDDLAYYDESKEAFITEDITYQAYIGTDEQSCVENSFKFTFNR